MPRLASLDLQTRALIRGQRVQRTLDADLPHTERRILLPRGKIYPAKRFPKIGIYSSKVRRGDRRIDALGKTGSPASE